MHFTLLFRRGFAIIATAVVAFFGLGCNNPESPKNEPPVITTDLSDQVVNVGGKAEFCVVASGTNPTYRWQKNGVDISNAVASCYTVSAVTPADSGAQIRCIITNDVGSDTSKAVKLQVGYGDSEFPYLYIVNNEVTDKADSVNAWYNTSHIPLLMQNPDLKAAYRYKNQDPQAATDYFTFFMYPSSAAMENLGTNTYFLQALAEMKTHWPNGEFTTFLAGTYEKIKSWVKDYSGSMQAISMEIVSMPAASESAINAWLNNTHIPLIMKYPGVKKTVRYWRPAAAATDANPSALPKYITVYYYGTKDEQTNQATSAEWAAVLANMDTETIDDQMTTMATVNCDFVKSFVR